MPPSAARRWSASFRLALNATRPRGGSRVPSRRERKRTSQSRLRAETAPPRQAPAKRVASIALVTAFWIALAVLLVAFVAGAVFVLVRALETKKALKSLKDALSVELQRISRAGERTNEELAAARKAFERLQASVEKLTTARTRLRLVNEALSEAESVLTRARSFIPSK